MNNNNIILTDGKSSGIGIWSNLRPRSSSIVIVGLAAYAIASSNSSTAAHQFQNMAFCETANNSYGTDSTTLVNYLSTINKSGLEKEAEILFGNMRGATIAEQDGIQTCIDGISMPTGHNFWD